MVITFGLENMGGYIELGKKDPAMDGEKFLVGQESPDPFGRYERANCDSKRRSAGQDGIAGREREGTMHQTR